MQDIHHSTQVIIDTQAYAFNLRALKQLAPKSLFCAVVKGNAYGHGLEKLAPVALANGANILGITENWEASTLAPFETRILRLRPAFLEEAEEAFSWNVEEIIGSLHDAVELNRVAERCHYVVPVHLKIDVGMGRTGFTSQADIQHIFSFKHLKVVGLMTHFPAADMETALTLQQLQQFELFCQAFPQIPKHAANSAATLTLPQTHLDCIRVGVATYGIRPSNTFQLPVKLKPVMSWQTRITSIREVQANTTIGYGMTFKAPHTMRIATLPIGYANGFWRSLENAEVLIRGQRQPLVGRISMNMITIDVTHSKAQVGDQVVLLGQQDNEHITAEELAEKADTISYEVCCAIGNAATHRAYL